MRNSIERAKAAYKLRGAGEGGICLKLIRGDLCGFVDTLQRSGDQYEGFADIFWIEVTRWRRRRTCILFDMFKGLKSQPINAFLSPRPLNWSFTIQTQIMLHIFTLICSAPIESWKASVTPCDYITQTHRQLNLMCLVISVSYSWNFAVYLHLFLFLQ